MIQLLLRCRLYRLGHGRATGRCRAWLRWCSSFLRELIRNGMDQPFTGDILHPSSAPILHGIGMALSMAHLRFQHRRTEAGNGDSLHDQAKGSI